MAITEKTFKDIAGRLDDGVAKFRAQLVEFGNITEAEAAKVFALYAKEKIATRDFVSGRWTVKNGAFLDEDVIRRAVEMVA